MAVIPLPDPFRIQSIEWRLDRPAQVNRSAYTGARRVVTQPGHARWSASLTLCPIRGEANILAMRAFLAKLKGQINTFRLPATETVQAPGQVPDVSLPGSAGDTHLDLDGTEFFGPMTFLAGQFITVQDQLLQIVEDSSYGAGGTNYTRVNFEPPLRAAVAATTVIEAFNPTALVALTGTGIGWSVSPGQLYGVSLEVEEVF